MNVVTFRTVAAGSVDYWLLSLHESGLRSGITTHDQASLPTWALVSSIIKSGKNAYFSGGLEDERQVHEAVLSGIQQVLALYPSSV